MVNSERTVKIVGSWLSLVERLVRVEEVEGSNPSGPTILIIKELQNSDSQTKPLTLSHSRSLVSTGVSSQTLKAVPLCRTD